MCTMYVVAKQDCVHVNFWLFIYSKVLEFIKAAQMPLTEQVFAALITAYGFNG